MRNPAALFACCLSLLVLPGIRAEAQEVPFLKTAIIETHVARLPSGVLEYRYTLTNPRINGYSIDKLEVDVSSPAGAGDTTGLPLGDGLIQLMSTLTAGAANALPAIGISMAAPVGWAGFKGHDAVAVWASTANAGLQPGKSGSGYTIWSNALPGLRGFRAETFIDPSRLSVDPPADESDLDRYRAQVEMVLDDASTTGQTVGPSTVPGSVSPVGFANQIAAYEMAAWNLKWIRSDTVHRRLYAGLVGAIESLTSGQFREAANRLSSTLAEVKAQAGKSLNSEADALLRLNIEYLLTQI